MRCLVAMGDGNLKSETEEVSTAVKQPVLMITKTVEPVLLETLVDAARYRGVCYRAANWIEVGMTQGRGRMDRSGHAQGIRKQIFLYPLHRRWRQRLCTAPPAELT